MEINEYKLPTINIAMVAPSGAGKTSLLSTVYEYIKEKFNRADGFIIKPCNQNDRLILNTFNQEVDNKLKAGSLKFKSGQKGTTESKLFEFELSFEKNSQKVSQIISIMDIPGGWITDPDSHKDFVEHLKKSHFLWIPIEAPVLMTAKTSQEKGWSTNKLQTTYIQELVNQWTSALANEWKNAKEEGREKVSPANVCFILSKCETFFSQDKTGKEAAKCKERFDENFKNIVQSIHDNYQFAQIHYVPVETIGPIKLIVSDWEQEPDGNHDWYLDTQYKITEKNRKIKGAKYLMDGVLNFAAEQIKALLDGVKGNIEQQKESTDKVAHSKNIFKWFYYEITGMADNAKGELKKINEHLMQLEELLKKFESLLPTITEKEDSEYFQNL